MYVSDNRGSTITSENTTILPRKNWMNFSAEWDKSLTKSKKSIRNTNFQGVQNLPSYKVEFLLVFHLPFHLLVTFFLQNFQISLDFPCLKLLFYYLPSFPCEVRNLMKQWLGAVMSISCYAKEKVTWAKIYIPFVTFEKKC